MDVPRSLKQLATCDARGVTARTWFSHKGIHQHLFMFFIKHSYIDTSNLSYGIQSPGFWSSSFSWRSSSVSTMYLVFIH